MKPFTLFWRTGKREVVHGDDAADAMTRAGYGGGALAALDFWTSGVETGWTYDVGSRSWQKDDICP